MNRSSNFYAKTAIILGIITIVTTLMATLYIPFITGSMAILFALLSRGRRKTMCQIAFAGVITSVIGLIINFMFIVTCITMYSYNPEILKQVNQYLEDISGVEIEDDASMSEMFNTLYDSYYK